MKKNHIAGRSVLDDLVDLGHRPCEVILGLLGESGQGFRTLFLLSS